MTLSTDIYITGTAVTQRQVYDKVNDLLNVPAERIIIDEHIDADRWLSRGADHRLSNQLGQGFAAIIDTYANEDGSIVECSQHEDDCDDGCASHYCAPPPHHVHVDLDTGYAYRGERGESCSMLHAGVIVALHDWLVPLGCSLHWVNEYTGDVHAGLDGLRDFIGNGAEADAWFATVAWPAILTHAAESRFRHAKNEGDKQ